MSDYDQRLWDWKRKHGLDPTHPNPSAGELQMVAEDQASKARSWCFGCDKEMSVGEMKTITRRIDPYTQCDESEGDYISKNNRVRMCPECFKERYEIPTEND